MSDDLDFMPPAPSGGSKEDGEGDAGPSKSKPKSTAIAKVEGGSKDTKPAGGEDRAPGERAELPTWNRSRRKRKANVKAEQQDDAFQRGVRKASRQVIDAPKLVLGAIVIFVAVTAGGVALHKRKLVANAEAARTLQAATAAIVRGQVLTEEEREQFAEQLRFVRSPLYANEDERQAAIEEALVAAQSAGREQVEQDATLVAAARAMRQAEFDEALSNYEAFLSATDEDHPLRFVALEGKGNALEAQGEYEAALEAFQAIAPNPIDHYRHMALYHQGRVLEALDRKDEALAIYEQYFEEFPASREEMATPLVRKRAEALDPEFAARLAGPPPSPAPTL